jgi:hypothetical protein
MAQFWPNHNEEKIGQAKFFCFNPCFMRARWSIFACMGSLDVEVTALTKIALLSPAANKIAFFFCRS